MLLLLVVMGLYLGNKEPRKHMNDPVKTVNSLSSQPTVSTLIAVPSVSLPAPPAYQVTQKNQEPPLVADSMLKRLAPALKDALKDSGAKLLREQEKGEGPNITIFWPDSISDRNWLKQRLYGCGVRLALFDGQGLTAIEKGSHALSAFMRPVEVKLSDIEQKRVKALSGEGRVVRVFPRYLDERMLVNFNMLSGNKIKKISADYFRKGNSLYIRSIVMDGSIFKKELELLPTSGCGNFSG